MAIFKKSEAEWEEKIKQLAENEQRFKDIFERSAVGESVVSLEGRWLDANQRLCEILGYSKKELLGKHFKDITYKDDIEISEKTRANVLLGKTPHSQLQKRYIRKDGGVVWVLLSISLALDDNKMPKYFVVHTQGITEFKKNEEELRESEKKYRAIIENGNDAIVIIQDNLIKFANSKILEVTGYMAKEIAEKPFLNFVAPAFAEMLKKRYADRLAGKKFDQRYEAEIIKKNDGALPVEISGSLVDYEGKPADMVFMRDISKRKTAEAELKKFKFIVEQSNQQIALGDMDGTLIYVNESLAKNHGYDAKELIGKNLSILHSKEELANVQNANKILIENGKFSGEITHTRKDGSTFPTFMDNFILNIDSKPKYLVGMAVDITKVKEAEKRVAEQKSLLDSIVKSTQDGLLVIDRQGKVVFYNERFKEFWKIPQDVIDTKDDKKLLDYVMDQLSNPKEFLDKVNYLYSHPEEESSDTINFKDGRIFERVSIPQKMENAVIGRIWSFNDVTEKAKSAKEEKERIDQIERINRLAIGRELKMVELKKEIEDLKKKIK